MVKKPLQYNVIFRSEPKGGFTAFVPSLPGCISFGKNLGEAQKMIVDAIKGYIVSLRKHNEVVPSDDKSFTSSVLVPQDNVVNV